MSAMSSIEGLSFDVDLLTKRLKQDMKDDWFPDPLNFKDTLKNDVIEKYFNKYHKSPATLYSPSVAEQFNLKNRHREGLSLSIRRACTKA